MVDLRLRELQSTDAGAAKVIREAATSATKDHEKDASRVKPIEISLFIVANKYDVFKSQSSADRRCLMQVSQCMTVASTAVLFFSLFSSLRSSPHSLFKSPFSQLNQYLPLKGFPVLSHPIPPSFFLAYPRGLFS